MELRDLEYFAVVAEHRHLGRAAEALGLSTPALSKSLRRLEKSMQAKLVARTPKGIELTAVGSAVLKHVYPLRLAHADVTREAADLSRGSAGDLRIGASPGFGEYLLPAACGALFRETQKVAVNVSVTFGSTSLLETVRKGELDLVICVAPKSLGERLVKEDLYDDEYVVYVSRYHRFATRKRMSLADIAQERWTLATTHAPWQLLHQLCEEHGLPQPNVAMVSNSVLLRQRTVAASDLLSVGSRRFLQEVAPRDAFVILPLTELNWRRTVSVIYRKGGYLPPAGRRFIELLKLQKDCPSA